MLSIVKTDKKCIGETDRQKLIRIKEQINYIKKNNSTSLIALHCNLNNHEMDFDNAETLALESMWQRRIIKESLLTQHAHGKAINEVNYILKIFD